MEKPEDKEHNEQVIRELKEEMKRIAEHPWWEEILAWIARLPAIFLVIIVICIIIGILYGLRAFVHFLIY